MKILQSKYIQPIFVCLLLICSVWLHASTMQKSKVYTIQDVPYTQKKNKLHFVSDPEHYLSNSTINQVNEMCHSIRQKSGAEVAVVILPWIDPADCFEFAHDLFHYWGIGQKGVDKRIDIIATAIKAGFTIFDLMELEFTYAPPFGSAKDPVNMLGYVASNIVEGLSDSVAWHEIAEHIKEGKRTLDVRSPDELADGQYPDATNIPVNELRDRLNELDFNQAYIISCASGARSYIAERILKQNGFTVANLDGGFQIYNSVKSEDIIHAND